MSVYVQIRFEAAEQLQKVAHGDSRGFDGQREKAPDGARDLCASVIFLPPLPGLDSYCAMTHGRRRGLLSSAPPALNNPPAKFDSLRKTFFTAFVFLALTTLHAFCADADYKQVLIEAQTNSVRVRLPLTDVTGKVRVKEQTPDGFGQPVAPSKTSLGEKHYLEWQIGYDILNTNSSSVVPEIKFIRNGETKYGHELSKIIFESVRLGLLSTNDIVREIVTLKKIQPTEFEENQVVQIEVSTNATANGFQSAVQRLPQFTKTTPHGWVQIQLKQKQRAVGYQAMVYVCLPMNQVLDMSGNPRNPGPAKSKETVYYDFNHENAAFILDIVHAFGIASQQHNEDIRQIIGKILRISTLTK
jgi:hypothetical protein